jgi:hypothetical protein
MSLTLFLANRKICVIPIKELFISWKKSNQLKCCGLLWIHLLKSVLWDYCLIMSYFYDVSAGICIYNEHAILVKSGPVNKQVVDINRKYQIENKLWYL